MLWLAKHGTASYDILLNSSSSYADDKVVDFDAARDSHAGFGTSLSLMPSYAFHVYAGVPQAEPTRQAATRPAKVYAKAPAWIEAAVSDLKRPLTPAGSGESGASFPPEDELPIVAALEKALGMPVKAVQGTSAAPAGTRGLILRLTMDPKTDSSWWLGMNVVGRALF